MEPAPQPPQRPPFELRFRLGSIPVAIEPGFWFISALVGLTGGTAQGVIIWVSVVLVSILVHELGHALAFRSLGTPVVIRLYSMGGLTIPDPTRPPLSRAQDAAVSLAGPLAGFLLGGLAALVTLLAKPTGVWAELAQSLLWVNFGWGIINLIPVAPLDGGHVLHSILGPNHRRTALLVSGLVGIAATGLLALLGLSFAAVLFALLAFQNFYAYSRAGEHPEETDPGVITVGGALQQGWDALRSGDEARAHRLGGLVLEQAPDPDARNAARDLLAWSALARANFREALTHLERSEPPESARALTWAMVLEAIEEPNRASPYALRAVEVEPSETSAALAVRVLAAAGRHTEALSVTERFPWPRPAARELALGEVAYAQGAFAHAARHYQSAFEQGASPRDAFFAGCAHARAGNRAEALAWLGRAVEAGFDDPDQLRGDSDLASLQGDPELAQLVQKAHGPPPG